MIGAGYQCKKHHCIVAENAECHRCVVEERDALEHLLRAYRKTLKEITGEARRKDRSAESMLEHIADTAEAALKAA